MLAPFLAPVRHVRLGSESSYASRHHALRSHVRLGALVCQRDPHTSLSPRRPSSVALSAATLDFIIVPTLSCPRAGMPGGVRMLHHPQSRTAITCPAQCVCLSERPRTTAKSSLSSSFHSNLSPAALSGPPSPSRTSSLCPGPGGTSGDSLSPDPSGTFALVERCSCIAMKDVEDAADRQIRGTGVYVLSPRHRLLRELRSLVESLGAGQVPKWGRCCKLYRCSAACLRSIGSKLSRKC